MAGDRSVHPTVEETVADIEAMRTRGASTIAAAVADALATQARESDATTIEEFRAELRVAANRLQNTRPTAVSLENTLRTVLAPIDDIDDLEALRTAVLDAADGMGAELSAARERIATIGANRLSDGETVLTQCHSTAVVAVLEATVDRGISVDAIVTETRPRYQGHVTARELDELGVDVTLVVDGAAGAYMDQIDQVMIGADSLAATGAVINKIGTANLAAVATDRGVPVVCHASTLKLHPGTLQGHPVPIEYRDEAEVLADPSEQGLDEITVENPAFDRTPPRHIEAIVTERGQYAPESVATLLRERFGDGPERPWE